MMGELTQKRLKELFHYDLETGILSRLASNSNRVKVGAMVGRNNGNGYLRTQVDGNTDYVHRLIWLYVYGKLPENEIDHIDGNRSNNKIANLRQATHAQNSQNLSLRCTNRSGKHGVSWSKLHSKWEAYIWVESKKKYLGLFEKLHDAGKAYLDAKKELHRFQPIPRDAL